MAGRIDFEFGFGQRPSASRDDDEQTRFYCLADFSGQTENPAIKIIKIDLDSFDAVMQKFSPSVLFNNQLLVFKTLDDFHPDHLLKNQPDLIELQRLKRGLDNPNTAATIAAELWQHHQPNPTTETITDSLDRLLERKSNLNEPNVQAKNTVDGLLKNIISPLIVADTPPEHQALSAFLDAAMTDLLNSILHHPDFQALEASWRTLYSLLFDEDEDENQRFYLIHAKKQNLATDINPIAQALINHGSKTANSIIIGDYYFSDTADDITLLASLGTLAEHLNSRFISAAEPAFIKQRLNDTEVHPVWQNLRQSSIAECIGLCCPRILLRLPYGKKREAIDSFDFEEFNNDLQHEQLLWGNPAFFFARLLVRENLGVQNSQDIDNLPALVHLKDDEQRLYPCAEYFLSEQHINKLLLAGLMPFISFQNRHSVRLLANQSLKAN